MPEVGKRWALVVHGGAKTIDPEMFGRNRDGCLAAVEAGASVLRKGEGAVAAVEAAVRCLEDDPVFNAGFGSVLNAGGAVEMDAAIMDGETLAIGAVTGVRSIRNPVSAARAMLDELPVLLAGEGAERFAEAQGMALCRPEDMISEEALASEKAHDTVGCVAIDMQGHVAAATSTGGLPGKHVGRIGDSPVPGSGFYADDAAGAVVFSGDGESILRILAAARAMHVLEQGTAGAAAREAIRRLERVGGEAGVIVIDREARIGVAHNSEHFAVAVHASWLNQPRAAVERGEIGNLLDG